MSEIPPAERPVRLWNIANILTIARIALVPVFVWFMVLGHHSSWWRVLAVAVFAVAAYTDQLDGHLARSRGLITDFGKIADPIADKALTGAALIMLSVFGWLWWWVTVLILVREWGITIMRLAIVRTVVIPASKGGKTKTVLQMAAIIVLILPFAAIHMGWMGWVGDVVMAAALALTLITGIDYVVKAVRAVRGQRARRAGA